MEEAIEEKPEDVKASEDAGAKEADEEAADTAPKPEGFTEAATLKGLEEYDANPDDAKAVAEVAFSSSED